MTTIAHNPCTGLIFRGRVSVYYNQGEINYRSSVRLLKRESCSCQRCDWILKDGLPDFFSGWPDYHLDVSDGEKYKLDADIDGEDGIEDIRFIKSVAGQYRPWSRNDK